MILNVAELPKTLSKKTGRDAVSEHKLHNAMTQLGVNYHGSSIVYNDEGAKQRDPASGYNKESETAAQPGDKPQRPEKLLRGEGEYARRIVYIL